MTDDRHQIIYHAGEPAYVLVPVAEWERIVERLEDLDDARAVAEWRARPDRETFPAAVVDALLDGANPVRVWREHRGLSRRELAEASGVTEAYVAQLEAGRRRGSLDVLRRVAGALRVDLDLLAGWGEEGGGGRPAAG